MTRKDRLSAILIVLFSALTARLALQLPIGKVGRPGPGIFPLVLSIVIGLLGLLLLSGMLLRGCHKTQVEAMIHFQSKKVLTFF